MQQHIRSDDAAQKPVIKRSRKLFGLLAAQERRVITILRALLAREDDLKESDRAFLSALPQSTRAAFLQLAAETRAHDLDIFGVHSTFVSEDELAILSRIILFQRPTQSGDWRIANSFQQALRRCAEMLAQEGRRLQPRVGRCDAYTERGGCFRIERTTPSPPASSRARDDFVWNGHSEPAPQSLKAKALAIVRTNRIARTAQFNAAGISNQYLSQLCKWGYVEKAGHGFYRFPQRFSKGDGLVT